MKNKYTPEELRLKAENERLKKENRRLKFYVLQLQAVLTRHGKKMAAIKGSLAFNETENTRLRLKNNVLIGIGDK